LLAFVILHSSLVIARAQPPFFQPRAGYYKARGTPRVETRWLVEPLSVPEDGELTATLVVRGAANPQEVVRPDLRTLPEFNTRFQVEDVPGPPVAADAKEVRFAYRLWPRNRDVNRVPSLDFFYFNPSVGKTGDPYQNARVRGQDITVTAAAPKPPPPPVPLPEPDHLFRVETGPHLLDREPFVPGPAWWLLLVALGPLVGVGWYVAWRRVYPDAARLARIRRSRAARRAADAIRRAGRTPDPPAAIAAAVLGYLRSRFPLPVGAETPAEVGAALRADGLGEPEADAVVGFLRECDAARFAPQGDTPVSLAADAQALLAQLEAAE
jgi:hypothetical protein